MTQTIDIWTDGACSGNPGPGGWGAVLKLGETEKEISGAEAATTNNRMELMAAISAIESLKRGAVQRATDLKGIVDDIRSSGITTVRGIADELHRRGIRAPRGDVWHPTAVSRLLSRIDA